MGLSPLPQGHCALPRRVSAAPRRGLSRMAPDEAIAKLWRSAREPSKAFLLATHPPRRQSRYRPWLARLQGLPDLGCRRDATPNRLGCSAFSFGSLTGPGAVQREPVHSVGLLKPAVKATGSVSARRGAGLCLPPTFELQSSPERARGPAFAPIPYRMPRCLARSRGSLDTMVLAPRRRA